MNLVRGGENNNSTRTDKNSFSWKIQKKKKNGKGKNPFTEQFIQRYFNLCVCNSKSCSIC